MAQIDTHRAAYNKPNGNIHCGKRDTTPTPTVTEQVTHFYTVKYGNVTKVVQSIGQVNAILAVNGNVSVVRTTKTVTTQTRHERVR